MNPELHTKEEIQLRIDDINFKIDDLPSQAFDEETINLMKEEIKRLEKWL